LGAYVVLDALGDGFLLVDPEGEQEIVDERVPFAGLLSKPGALFGEEDAPVRLGPHVALSLQVLDRLGNRHMADSEIVGEVHCAGLLRFAYQGVYELDTRGRDRSANFLDVDLAGVGSVQIGRALERDPTARCSGALAATRTGGAACGTKHED